MTGALYTVQRFFYTVLLNYYLKDPAECLFGDQGFFYKGTTNTTVSGRTCQLWSSQTPHSHPKNYKGAANHCRNRDGEPKPWCYTTDPDVRWELCDIPLCGKF